jgi:hypothetical protein
LKKVGANMRVSKSRIKQLISESIKKILKEELTREELIGNLKVYNAPGDKVPDSSESSFVVKVVNAGNTTEENARGMAQALADETPGEWKLDNRKVFHPDPVDTKEFYYRFNKAES